MATTTITVENFTDEELRIEVPDANPAKTDYVGKQYHLIGNIKQPGSNAVTFPKPNKGITLFVYKKGTNGAELASIDVKETQTLKFKQNNNGSYSLK